jgi:hypothetical protein
MIGRGRTFLGEQFVATVGGEGRPPEQLSLFAKELKPRGGCPLPVAIKEGARARYNVVCYAPSGASEQAGVECSVGLLLIHLVAPPSTRSVRLTLSDGRQITSPVMMLARRFGGPMALYYQTVRGPSPIPVSATELGARGQVLDTIRANPVHECSEDTVRTLSGGRVLLKARALGGETFEISSVRTRILGRTHFGLRVVLAGGSVSGTAALRLALPLEWEVSRICTPQTYGLIYGVLASPRDEALVRIGAALQPLHRAAIPASVRRHSVLVYGTLARAPDRLIVRDPGERTTVDENIGPIVAEKRCA